MMIVLAIGVTMAVLGGFLALLSGLFLSWLPMGELMARPGDLCATGLVVGTGLTILGALMVTGTGLVKLWAMLL